MDGPLIQAPDPALRAWVIGALRGLVKEFDGPIDDDTPLGVEGLCLDSLALFDLVVRVEEHLGVAITEDDIVEAHFGTVGRLLRFLAAGRAPAP